MAMTMSAGAAGGAGLDQIRKRQTLITGIVLLALAVFVMGVFGVESEGDATFRLALPGDAFALPNLVVPAAPYIYTVAALLAFFGARQFVRGAGRRSIVYLGIGFGLVVTAFLVWSTAGKSFNLTGMLEATVVRAVPIALGGLVGDARRTGGGGQHRHRRDAAVGRLRRGGGRLRLHRLVGQPGVRRVGRTGRRGRRRRADGADARRAGDHLPGRPDHRRGGDQPVRAGADVIRVEPGADPAPVAEQRPGLPRHRHPVPEHAADRRAGAVPAEHLRLRGGDPDRGWRPTTCSTRAGGCAPAPSASTRRPPTRSASTSTNCATST